MTLLAGSRWWFFGVAGQEGPSLPDPPGKSLDDTHPVLAAKWRRVHQRHPSHTNSARRLRADQQEFFDCFQAKLSSGVCPPGCGRSQCASANPPGMSNHEFGLAIDGEPLDEDVRTWRRVCAEEGLIFVIASEEWHVQDEMVTSGSFDGFPDDWRPA
jgi:hypothetical protein